MKLKIYGENQQLWQWDTNQKLIVEDYGTCSAVHFCNATGDIALVVPVKDLDGLRVVDVPNIFLQKASMLTAYLFSYAQEGSETRVGYHFAVRPRPKPEDYVYTDTEVLNYASLDKRITDLEGDGLAQAVADYLAENPVETGATEEEAAQIAQNKQDIENLTAEKLDAAKLPEAVNDALAQAKASGEFKGEKGETGEKGEKGEKGDPGEQGSAGIDGYSPVRGTDYWTEADKAEIKSYVDNAILGGAW